MSADCGKLRLAREEDAESFLEIYAPIVRETPISFETEPPSAAEMRTRIADVLKFFPWLVEEDENGVVGYAYASRHRDRAAYQWSADVSCYVHSRSRRSGVGKRLYTALLAILSRQGFHAAFAGIALPNAASEALHGSVGFERIGVYREVGFKAGAWRDTGWYQRTLGPSEPDPQPPRALEALGPGILDQL